MINNLIQDGYYVTVVSEATYLKAIEGLEKQIKGKSKFDSYSIIEYLPKNKEFYVIEDNETEYENGYASYEFTIFIKHNNLYFGICDCGSN